MSVTWGDHNGPHNFDPYYLSGEEERKLIEREAESNSAGCKHCQCIDNDAWLHSECFCLCHSVESG